ncbi:MAG: ATP-binding protein [Rhodobacteraceae bacterium CG17_big_fil_post_rev_8_21_14_2_50_65_11]|nr:MAG: ATP-binding protein [Rhodobacteraceae bacterium CG17_big_fil_post_rev_8_21_14_2_50_65_11]
MNFQGLPITGDSPPTDRPRLGWSSFRRFPAVPQVVTMELVGLNQTLTQLGLPIESLFSLELVLAEVLNNIVEHSYEDRGEGMIELAITVYDHAIHCDVTDHGNPMPNGCLPPKRRYDLETTGLHDLPEGGFGWGLIRDMTCGLSYTREAGVNRLCFYIDLAA